MSDMDLRRLARVLEKFGQIDVDISLPALLTLVYTAIEDGLPQSKLEEKLGLSNAAASRNISYWSLWKKHMIPGHGMMTSEVNPMDRRHKSVHLTPKGKAFVLQLSDILEN